MKDDPDIKERLLEIVRAVATGDCAANHRTFMAVGADSEGVPSSAANIVVLAMTQEVWDLVIRPAMEEFLHCDSTGERE